MRTDSNKIVQSIIDTRLKCVSEEDRRILLDWLNKSPENIETYRRILRGEEFRNRYFEEIRISDSMDVEAIAQNIAFKLRSYRRKKLSQIIAWSGSVAALIAVAIITFASMQNQTVTIPSVVAIAKNYKVPTLELDNGESIILDSAIIPGVITDSPLENNISKENTIYIPSQYTYSVDLEDGSKVYLNANSSLTYPSSFAEDVRRVTLKGEAYFVIAKSERRFIVECEDAEIIVYGTEFNINSHKEGCLEAYLVCGSAGIKFDNSDKEIEMLPYRLLQHNTISGENIIKTIPIEENLGWRSGSFDCELKSLEDLLQDISIWYGVEFIYAKKRVASRKVSVSLSRNMQLTDIMEVLSMTCKFNYSFKEGGICMIK